MSATTPTDIPPALDTDAGASSRAASGAPTVTYLVLKRCLDVMLAVPFLVVALPLFAVISLLIVLDGGWPVFYRQERIGARPVRHNGRLTWIEHSFRIVKFRTMVRGADRTPVHEQFIEAFVNGQAAPDASEPVDRSYKLATDARITRIGRLLRATSLDELPQLLNVVAGTMSLVGPRPVPPYEVALYAPGHRERLAARPGITGAWQVQGRGRVSFDEMMDLDIDYVRHQSLRLDLSLLARTLPAVLRRSGAR
jgi:lipopolysaccharide/colanic/teichoic acid biosynthesis glycosyltransferase